MLSLVPVCFLMDLYYHSSQTEITHKTHKKCRHEAADPAEVSAALFVLNILILAEVYICLERHVPFVIRENAGAPNNQPRPHNASYFSMQLWKHI